MRGMGVLAMGVAGALVAGGCASESKLGTVKPASAAQEASLLGQVKGLAGEWDQVDEHGKAIGTISFKVTSGGNVVREVMFPGTEHEMTNVYHMDGDSLVMTHYCAVGNQPRMRARRGTLPAGGKPGEIALTFDSVSNHRGADEPVMGNMTLVFVDQTHYREEWRNVGGGGEHNVVLSLRRR